MINVLHVGKFYHPYAGGMETVLRGLARSLHAHDDVSVRVLVCNDAPRTVSGLVDGIPVRRLASLSTLASQPICPALPYWLWKDRADVVHLHLPNPLAGLSFLLAGRRCPLVVTYHADIVRQRYLLKPYLALLHRVLRRADRIVVATPNHIKYSRILPRYAGKCTVIPFGIDLSRFRLTAEIARAVDAIRRAHPGPRVLFIGRLVYYKGVEYLIRAMGRVDARLFVIGSGPLEGKLKALAGSGNLAGKIAFLGWVPEREKLAHLHACDLLVLPSVEPAEAFGMTQIEAMACSKPVVSTDLPSGVACVNRHGVTGLVVPPRDPAALAGAINRLLGDAVLRRRLGAAGRHLAESEYAEQRMGQRYRRVYLDIVGPAPGREAESRPLAYRAA